MHRVDISPGTITEFSIFNGTTPQASPEELLDTPAWRHHPTKPIEDFFKFCQAMME
jgi:hypothetical protein